MGGEEEDHHGHNQHHRHQRRRSARLSKAVAAAATAAAASSPAPDSRVGSAVPSSQSPEPYQADEGGEGGDGRVRRAIESSHPTTKDSAGDAEDTTTTTPTPTVTTTTSSSSIPQTSSTTAAAHAAASTASTVQAPIVAPSAVAAGAAAMAATGDDGACSPPNQRDTVNGAASADKVLDPSPPPPVSVADSDKGVAPVTAAVNGSITSDRLPPSSTDPTGAANGTLDVRPLVPSSTLSLPRPEVSGNTNHSDDRQDIDHQHQIAAPTATSDSSSPTPGSSTTVAPTGDDDGAAAVLAQLRYSNSSVPVASKASSDLTDSVSESRKRTSASDTAGFAPNDELRSSDTPTKRQKLSDQQPAWSVANILDKEKEPDTKQEEVEPHSKTDAVNDTAAPTTVYHSVTSQLAPSGSPPLAQTPAIPQYYSSSSELAGSAAHSYVPVSGMSQELPPNAIVVVGDASQGYYAQTHPQQQLVYRPVLSTAPGSAYMAYASQPGPSFAYSQPPYYHSYTYPYQVVSSAPVYRPQEYMYTAAAAPIEVDYRYYSQPYSGTFAPQQESYNPASPPATSPSPHHLTLHNAVSPSQQRSPSPASREYHPITGPASPQYVPAVQTSVGNGDDLQPDHDGDPSMIAGIEYVDEEDAGDAAGASYPCPTCPKSFRARANLRDHLRIHNRARNHPCPTCHKTFYRSQDLLRHQSTHMLPSERPHVCPNGCGRRFGRADAAYRHAKTSQWCAGGNGEVESRRRSRGRAQAGASASASGFESGEAADESGASGAGVGGVTLVEGGEGDEEVMEEGVVGYSYS